MEIVTEIWKDVKGREGMFQVSDQGRVRALPFQFTWRGRTLDRPGGIVKQSRHSGGYQVVSLRDNKKHYVHRLVMEAFAGESGDRDVNHIDGVKSNNCHTNLEYCDRLHNVRHAIATGLQDNGGEGNGMHKYKADSIRNAHRMVKCGATQSQAAQATGVSESTVQAVVTGRRWKCLNLVGEPAA
jgi:hypothetical protein